MKKKLIVSLTCTAVATLASAAYAITPAPGDIFYEAYDFGTKLSSGPPAALVGLGGVALGGFFLFKQQVMPAAGSAVGAILIAKAAPIATTITGLLM